MNFKIKITDFVRCNKKELIILGIILLIASFCRLYKISSYMTFLGDEGRDVIIVRRLLVEGHPPLIGPGTSVGNMYLGPLYYYMMAPALLLANFSPIGPAVMIAILGIITVAFVWWVGRIWFSKSAGLIAAGLYAISPTIIYYSRSSWNPNIMPFFALLSVFSVWKVWKQKKFNWLIVMGISFAFVLQSHYLGLLLAPTLFLFWILTFRYLKFIKNSELEIGKFLKKSMLGLLFFLGLMSPLLIFDLRHNWMNAEAFYAFFTARQPAISVNFLTAFLRFPALFNQIITTLLGGKNPYVGWVMSIFIIIGVIILFSYVVKNGKNNLKNMNPAIYILFSWIGFALIGLCLYTGSIYDHYSGFVFVVPFLLTGIFISRLLDKGRFLKGFGIIITCSLVLINLSANPLLKDPNRLLQRSIDVSKVIEQNSDKASFNLAVIADTNYEDGYKYFLLNDNYPVVDIDAQKPDTVTNQLFVICELIPNSKCDPTHNPKAQVASFGWSKIYNSWNIDGVIIYRLVHTK
ncbi:MAG TPA: glycosyltransferase family 39 protein [Candidatus Saccharimonadales bacterium]|nr:glycosyltransferase family 39 protein [Candidatus Saccharimonadales bacterium]